MFLPLISAQEDKTIQINPYLPASSPQKEGYILLFSDEFNAFDPVFWNRSAPGDDGINYGVPGMCADHKGSPPNPSNVSAHNGVLQLRARAGEEQNACAYSASEIKSFSTLDDDFGDWVLPEECYVEARIKVTSCKGVGSAFWMWGLGWPDGVSEPDVFELYKEQRDRFQANFRYAKDYDLKIFDDPATIVVQDENKKPVELPDHFLNYAIYLNKADLSMELNGIQYYHTDMFFDDEEFLPLKRHRPYHIRIGTGPTVDGGVVGDCDDLPDTMKVDYVRVYLKEGTKAVTLLDFDGVRYKPTSRILTCSWPTWGVGASVYVPYYPGATYTWQYDPSYVEVLDPSGPQGNKYHFWVAPIENIPQGIYMAHLTVAFPSGYQEMLDLEVEVQPHTPVPPAEILVLKNPPSVAYPVGVWKQPGTLGYEWSTDGGLTWTSAPNGQFQGDYNVFEVYEPIGVPQEIDLCVSARNKCGFSEVLCETVIIPVIGGGGAFLAMAPKPDTVWVAQTDATGLYELRTPLLDATTAFTWSFDQETWFLRENTTNDSLNRLGFFTAGTPPFQIHIRSAMDSLLSEVYSQWIEIPDTTDQSMGLQQLPGQDTPAPGQHAEDFSRSETIHSGPAWIEVYSIQGILVWKGSLTQFQEREVRAPAWAPGIYIVITRNELGGIYSIQKTAIIHP